MSWRPIESAPKDGTPFLAWQQTHDGGFISQCEWADILLTQHDTKYTFWMPLPAPPGSDPGIPVYKLEDGTDEFVKKNK